MNHYTRFFNILIVLLSLFSFDCLAQNNDIVITQQPIYESVCAGEGANFSVEVNGADLAYQWQVRSPYGFENIIDNSGYSGAQTSELGISSITKSMNLWEYRCEISSGTTKTYSKSTFLVLKNALLSYSPKDAIGYKGDTHLFYVQATGEGLVYQWQVNTGEGFSNIDNGTSYEGTDKSVMNIKEVSKKMEGYQFRCLISGEACESIVIVSDAATLSLSTAPNLLKSISSGTPDNVVWYMDGGSEDDNAVRFMGNPLVYVDGAIKMVNNGQISSEPGNESCEVQLTGNIYNENAATNLFSAGDDTVFEFIGSDEQKIYGEDANNPDEALDHTNFYSMVLNKSTSDDKLQLHDDISVRDGVYFQTGDLELNAQELELTYLQLNDAPYSLSTGNNSFPIISSETEDNRVTGVNGGEIVVKDLMILNNPTTAGLNLGNIGAEIIQNSGTDFLAETTLTLKRGHTTNSNGTTSINRYYDINLTETSTENPVGNVPVDAAVDFKFLYLDGDNTLTEVNLNLYKSEDGMTIWENQEANAPDETNNFVVKENVENLTGEWTLFPCNDVPVVTIVEENNNSVTEVRLCHGASTTINTSIVYAGSDAITYQWILDGTVTAETGSTYSMTGVSGENNQTLVVAASNSTGCLSKYQVVIIHEDELVLDVLNDTEALCGESSIELPNLGVNTLGDYANGAEWKVWNNTEPANILATISGTTYTFDTDIAPFSTPGNYTVEVTANTAYCSVTDLVVITVNEAVIAGFGTDISICTPINSTILNPNASGGSGSYTYSWTPNNPINGAATYQVENINTTTTYSVLITDANDTNCTITDDIILNYSNIGITPSAGIVTDISCHGANTGVINFMVSGAVSPIVITDGNDNAFDMMVNNAGDITISELLAGNYTVKITDGNGCIFEEFFMVDEPAPLALDGSLSDMISNILCNGETTGAIDLAITGGSLPYTYSWSGSNVIVNSQDQTGLSVGTYTVLVTDGNDCEFIEDFIITEPTNPLALNGLALDMIINVNCFGEETGAINLAVMGGTINGGTVLPTDGYQIGWSGPELGTAFINNDPGSFLIDNLKVGSYTVTITDDNDCTINQDFEITEPAAALAVASMITSSCSDSDSGAISLTTTGGFSPYSYSWSPATVNGSSPIGLAGGFYSVTITDNNGCDFILTNLEILSLPALNPNAIVTDVSCNGLTDGAINLTPTGGSETGYEFAWENDVFTSTQEDIGTLSPADYNLTITDDNGCTTQTFYTVASPDVLLLNEVLIQMTCNAENDGSISLNVTGGNVADPADYVYQWAGNLGANSSTGSSLTDLAQGTYLVTVTDDNMCETTGNFMIIEPNIITTNPVQTNISCFFTDAFYDDGEINLNAEGGTNLEYDWSGPPPNEFQSSDNIFSLSEGTYNVTISDENGCSGPELEFIITKPLPIDIDIVVNQLDCFGDTDGQINLNPTGGTSPYSIEWEYPDESSITTPSNISFINNLSQTGIYTYLITDANGCNYPDISFQEPPYFNEIELTSPSEILIVGVVTDLTTNGQNNGAIDITISGGTPLAGADPYTVLWSNGATTEDLTGISGGTYMVDITDANGCLRSDTFDVYEPDELMLQVEIQQNPECIGSDNGVLSVNIEGGVEPYIISWSFGAEDNTIFYNLAPGDYTLTVTDANGTTVIETYTLVNPVPIDAGELITPLTCNGGNDASIILNPSWAADPANNSFEYQWEDFPTNTTNTINNLASGDYTVTITYTVLGTEIDTYCEFIETYTITEPDPILTTLPTVSPTTCAGGNDGSIDLVPTGGTSPFTYNWTNTSTLDNGTGAQITGLLADTYQITITDADNCTMTTTAVIAEPTPVNVFITGNALICDNASTVFDAGSGTGFSSYLWSPNGEITPTITVSDAGIYSVVVTNADGCTATANRELIVSPASTISNVVTTCDLSNIFYSIDFASDGFNISSDFGTVIDNMDGTYTISNVPSDQGLNITSQGSSDPSCFVTEAVTADCSCNTVPDAPVILTDELTICEEETIPTFTAIVGTNETVDWYNVPTNGMPILEDDLNYTPTAAGIYYAEARSTIDDCTSATRTSITLTINSLPTADAGVTATICTGESTTLDASASSGNTTLNYSWTPIDNLNDATLAMPIATPTTGILYTVVVTDQNGCSETADVMVNVNALPTLLVNGSSCSADLLTYSIEITTDGDQITQNLTNPAITITDNGGGSFIIAEIPTAEDIVVTSTNSLTDCQQTSSLNFPDCSCDFVDAPVNNGDASYCFGTTPLPTLSVSVNAGETVDWYDSATGNTLLLADNLEYSPAQAGIYYAETRNEITNCISSIRTPVMLISNDLPTADAGEDVSICLNEEVVLDASIGSTGFGNLMYTWSPATGLSATDISNPIASPTETTIYTVEVTDENGCVSTGEVELTVKELPVLNILSSNCTPDFENYNVELETNDGDGLFASTGTIVDNGGGFFTITDIPVDENISVTALNLTTGCESIPLEIEAPNCDCPSVENPISNGNITICEGELITALSVDVNAGETADWYNTATGGDLLLAGNTSYLPTEAGTFYVEARNELNDCSSDIRVPVSLIINALPLVSFDEPADVCDNGLAIALTATPANGTFSGVGVTGNLFDPSLLIPGLYTLSYTFTNDNGCTNSAMQNIQVLDVPIVTALSNSPVCVGESLTLTELGGEAIDWVWTSPNGLTFNEQSPMIEPFTSAEVGIYELVITNINGCTNTTSIMTELNPEVVVNITPDNPTFCPGSSAEITAIASGANGDYNYTWESPSGIISMDALVDATEEGVYIWTVTDNLGCSKTGTQQVIENPAMTINFTANEASCNEFNGSLSAAIIGGTPPFFFEWEGLTNTTSDLINIASGSYPLTVTDGLGCVFSDIGIVSDLGDLIITQDEIVDVLCTGEATGRIDLLISGGLSPYTFIWSNGATTASIEDLESGDYIIEVTDANGCSVTSLIPIIDPLPLESTTVITPTSSNIASDGAIDLTVTGGTGGYEYLWNTGSPNEDLSNLFMGTYSVTINDENDCELIENATISPIIPLAADLFTQNISCAGLSNGSIEVVATGTLSPFSYLWNTGSMTENLTNLSPGTYTVTVTDQSGDMVVETTNLTAISDMQAIEQITDVQCNGNNDGAAIVFVSGGESDYVFNWSMGDTGPTISGQSAGDYVVTITDNLGCTLDFPVTIGEPSALTVITESITPVDCFGNETGAIDISISGGVGPYTQVWSQGSLSEDVTDLAAGDYNVFVTDFNQCATNIPFTITESDLLIIDISVTDVLCFGEATGSLMAMVSGGVPAPTGYTYLWSTGEGTPSIDNLLVENYFVTVTDNLECTQITNEFVNQPLLLSNTLTIEEVSCFSFDDGSALAEISGGTLPYDFAWSNGSTDALAENLEVGIYTLVVTDAANCEFTEEVEIMEPDTLNQSYAVTDLNCFGDFGGAIDLSISGGTGDYSISWSNGQFVENIDQLNAGEYTVIITDDNNCINYDTIIVNQPDVLSVVEEVQDALCYNDENGRITLMVSGGTLPYDFDWSTGAVTTDAITSQIENLSEGNYSSLITDENGCEIVQQTEVMQPDLLSLDFQIQRAGCTTDEDGSIDLTISGGIPIYTYLWSNAETSENLSDITAGDYVVTVSDLNDCTIEQSFGVAETDTTFTANFLAASGLFDVDSVEVLADEIIQFADISYPQPLTWQWYFNNPSNSTSNLPHPSFSYLADEDDTVDETAYFPQLIVSNLFCTDSIVKTIWITNNLRITAPEVDSLVYLGFEAVNVYPNPSSGLVTVDVELTYEHSLKLSVIDVLGNIHQQKTLEGDNDYRISLDLTDFMPGVYFVNLYSLDQIYTVKVVIVED